MAVKFTFTLNDEDASNLMAFIHSEKCRILDMVVEEMTGDDRSEYVEWYRNHAAYIDRIRARVLSCQERVPDSPDHDCDGPPAPKGTKK